MDEVVIIVLAFAFFFNGHGDRPWWRLYLLPWLFVVHAMRVNWRGACRNQSDKKAMTDMPCVASECTHVLAEALSLLSSGPHEWRSEPLTVSVCALDPHGSFAFFAAPIGACHRLLG